MSVLVDTSTVSRGDRAEHWAAAHERLFFPVDVEFAAGAADRGRIEGHDFGLVGVYRVRSDASVVRRGMTEISSSDPEQFLVGAPLAGRFQVEQGGRVSPFARGEISSWHSSRPFAVTQHGPFELLLAVMPIALLGPGRDRIARRTATAFPANAGVGRLTMSLLRQAWELPDGEGPDYTGDDISEAVLALIRALYRSDQRPSTGATQLPSALLRAEIKRYLIRHLGESTLRPEAIARAHFISTRYLHKLFAAEATTVSGWIRARRLEGCRRALRDPELASVPIGALAARWGLPDPAHFSRLFRRAYGISPSAYRADALGVSGT